MNLVTKILLILCLTLTYTVHAQENNDAGGPPSRDQLIGVWKNVEIPNASKINKVNPWPQKFQWFAFYENGKIYSMMSDKDYDYSSKELMEIFNTLPSNKTPNFVLNGLFLTIDNKENKNYIETWGVNLFTKDFNEFIKKGYLIMSLDNGQGDVVYYRLLKKID